VEADAGVGRPFDVSICVVSWNGGEHLRALLPALEDRHDELVAQVIVVDNGSADATQEVLAAHPDVQVIRNSQNRGITRARNQALMLVRGRHVLMLDVDTRLHPKAIDAMVSYLEMHPEVGLVGGKLLNPDGSVQESCRTVPPASLPFLRRPPLERWFERSSLVDRHLMRDFDHQEPRPVDWVMGACQLYRASLLPTLGAYDERIFSHGGEDTDWCLRVWKAGFEVHYVPAAEVVHEYGHFTRKNPFSKQAVRALTDYYHMIWKHRDARSGFAP
jgi:GT2 family glycosyltransferase